MLRFLGWRSLAGAGLVAIGLLAAEKGAAQSALPRLSALPAVPYWWNAPRQLQLEALPLAWYNDLDGVVVGGAGQWRVNSATVWSGLGIGLRGDGGFPAGFEAAAEFETGGFYFRTLHGRNAFTVHFLDIWRNIRPHISVGITGLGLTDERYLETVPLFECPSGAPSAPCTEVPTPYGWSAGRDHALELGLALGEPENGAGRFDAVLAGGLKVVGGDYEYLRAEAGLRKWGLVRSARWTARLAGGWVSNRAPQQRRFRLDGANSIIRWLYPYLEAQGALLEHVPYFVPGGGHLRAYEDTRPLVKSYLGLSGAVSGEASLSGSFWGEVAAFAEAAWTPGLPDPLGPEDLNPDSDFLFDWQQLPAGEGRELGQFRARVLNAPEIWADAGLAFTGRYERLAVTISFPLWASASAFAGEPFSDNEKRAFAMRWNLTITVVGPQSFPVDLLQGE